MRRNQSWLSSRRPSTRLGTAHVAQVTLYPSLTSVQLGMASTTFEPVEVAMKSRRWRAIGLATFIVAGFLLLSTGGAIAASPVTLPLMYLARRRHPNCAFRFTSVVIGGLTAAEVAWALTYLAVGEARPWIWLLPLMAAATAIRLYAVAPHHDRVPAPA